MHLGRDGYDRSTGTSGTLGPPSGKAILLKLAPERLVRPTHTDAPDAHFVVADACELAQISQSSTDQGSRNR